MLRRSCIYGIASLLMLAILGGGSGVASQGTEQATEAATASAATPGATITFGPGRFDLQPLAGLTNLSGYQATLSIDFTGKTGGQGNPWTETLAIAVNAKPSGRVLTATFKGNTPAAGYVAPWSAALNGVFYRRTEDGSCVGRAIEAQTDPNALPPVWEPADFLPGVIGAEDAGAKQVNGMAAKGYKFDERALGLAGRAKATGEVWVVDPGAYVLKYSLTLQGGPEYFGDGGEGTLTWAYDLTNAGKPAAIALPKDCPEGLVDAPAMDDAQNVQRLPGATLFTTKSTPAQVAVFYQKALPKAGWKVNGTPSIGAKAGLLSFQQAKSQLTLFIAVGDKGTEVKLLLASQ